MKGLGKWPQEAHWHYFPQQRLSAKVTLCTLHHWKGRGNKFLIVGLCLLLLCSGNSLSSRSLVVHVFCLFRNILLKIVPAFFFFFFEVKYQCQKAAHGFLSFATIDVFSVSQLLLFYELLNFETAGLLEIWTQRKEQLLLKMIVEEVLWGILSAQAWVLLGGCFVDLYDCSGHPVNSFKYFLFLLCEGML